MTPTPLCSSLWPHHMSTRPCLIGCVVSIAVVGGATVSVARARALLWIHLLRLYSHQVGPFCLTLANPLTLTLTLTLTRWARSA